MNAGDPGWQDHLIAAEQAAYQAYPFDGWQADQLGDRGTVYTCDGDPVEHAQQFDSMISAYGAATGKQIVFNAVSQYGQQQVADNPHLGYLYTEVWGGTYADLKQIIDDNRTWSGGKGSVLAAYLNSTHAESGGTFNLPGVLTTNAVVFAAGGAHNELGDIQHMLNGPYYPNANLDVGADLRAALLDYYNFLVAYENLLRGLGVAEVDATTRIANVPTSTNGQGNTVWTFTKTSGGREVVHFLNLLGNEDTAWDDTNATRNPPTALEDVTVRHYYHGGTPTTVNLASPDIQGGEAMALDFTTGHDDHGRYVEFALPSLSYWDLVWLDH